MMQVATKEQQIKLVEAGALAKVGSLQRYA
jgi:hypothetical protein